MNRTALLLAVYLFGALACSRGGEPFPGEPWLKRLQANSLSAEQLAEGVVLAMKAQADDLVTFDSHWGEFLELARAQGKLSEEQWRDYLYGALRFQVRVARWAKRRTGLMVFFMQETTRAGRNGFPAQALGSREVDVSGVELRSEGTGQKRPVNFVPGGSGMGWAVALNEPRYAALQPGPQTLHYRYVIRITEKAKPEAGGKTYR